jgi:signal transduction histidine kinase
MLIRARVQRERVFADLERSHQALELAHTRLEAAHRQLEEASAHEREIAVLRERERLARDMHDTLGHALVLANVKLEAALRLRSIDPARADHEITVTQQVLRDSMADLRVSLANLRSSPLPREPLGQALVRLANEAAARATWEVFTDVAAVGELEDRTYEALLRIGSEAITNAERHAGAHSLWVQLENSAREGSVVLRVSDDGIGIFSSFTSRAPSRAVPMSRGAGGNGDVVATLTVPVEAASPDGHYGITGMRERITALGGQLVIQPLRGTAGTVIEARLPVPERCAHEIP